MEVIKQELGQYITDDGSYNISIDNLRDILMQNIPKEKPKRPQSAFFLWKSKNKVLVLSKVTEKGRGVVASKAAEIWNTLSDEDKQPFIDEAAKLRETYHSEMSEFNEHIVVENPSSKRPGRPKLSEDEKTKRKADRVKSKTTRTPMVEDTSGEDEDMEINVDDFQYDGKEFLIDINSGDIYDPETEDIVGKKVGESVTIF